MWGQTCTALHSFFLGVSVAKYTVSEGRLRVGANIQGNALIVLGLFAQSARLVCTDVTVLRVVS